MNLRFRTSRSVQFIGAALSIACANWTAASASQAMNSTQETYQQASDRFWAASGLGEKELNDAFSETLCFTPQARIKTCSMMLASAYARIIRDSNQENLVLVNSSFPGLSQSIVRDSISDFVAVPFEAISKKAVTKAEFLDSVVSVSNLNNQATKAAFSSNPRLFLNAYNELRTRLNQTKMHPAHIAATVWNVLVSESDPHARLQPVDLVQWEQNRTDFSGNYSLPFSAVSTPSGPIVSRLTKSLFLQGLRPGDTLISMNNKRLDSFQALASVPIPEDKVSTVHVIAKRGDKKLELRLKTEPSNFKTFEVKPFTVIRKSDARQLILRTFTVKEADLVGCDFLAKTIHELPAEVRYIALDFRGNGGGQMSDAACIAAIVTGKEQGDFLRYVPNTIDPKKLSLSVSEEDLPSSQTVKIRSQFLTEVR